MRINDEIFKDNLSDKQFNLLKDFIEGTLGIKMPLSKKIMIESRIRKRLRTLEIDHFSEYLDYVFNNPEGSQEVNNLIDVVTTNKTEFFREKDHFIYLQNKSLPYLINSGGRFLKVWSAACSSGEEVYSIGITLAEFIQSSNKYVDFSILGTDISTEMLNKAYNAIYTIDSVRFIPKELLYKYFLKSKDLSKKIVRVISQLREKTSFKKLNFMDNHYNVDKFHIIFCRNALIYFDQENQIRIVKNLVEHLEKKGFLFLGHSESIINEKMGLKRLGPSIYQNMV
ncbi:MAG: protein-glutamate O-methyltransferase CheR [Thermoplasmata archaeon]